MRPREPIGNRATLPHTIDTDVLRDHVRNHVGPFAKWLFKRHQMHGGITEIRTIVTQPMRLTWAAYFRPGHVNDLIALITPGHNGPRVKIPFGESPWVGEANFYFAMQPVKEELLARSAYTLNRTQTMATDADIAAYSLFAVDVDPVRISNVSATDAEKLAARQLTKKIAKWFEQYEISPIWADSGNGYHLLIPTICYPDVAKASSLARTLLELLDHEFSNDKAKVDTTIYNPSRILKLYGTLAMKGSSLVERPHRLASIDLTDIPADVDLFKKLRQTLIDFRNRGDSSSAKLSTQVAKLSSPKTTRATSPSVVERARKYLKKMPAAISGQHGSSTTLTVASRIVVGFDIPHDSPEALQLLQEYNQVCQPPWSDTELKRKLSEADRLARDKGETRGLLNREAGRSVRRNAWEPLPGTDFLMEIPDYAPIAADQVNPPHDRYAPFGPYWGLTVLRVWQSQVNTARIPDVVARQVYWGAHHPQGWRRTLKKLVEANYHHSNCGQDCPLYGKAIRHKDLIPDGAIDHGYLEHFHPNVYLATRDERNDVKHPDHFPRSSQRDYRYYSKHEGYVLQRKSYHQRGRIYLGYYPLFVFGGSCKIGLNYRQLLMISGITRELTRATNSGRSAAPPLVETKR